jgi:integrase
MGRKRTAGLYERKWRLAHRQTDPRCPHLARMALFKVNTGTPEMEVCGFRWEWEVPVPELDTSVFIIPEDRVKNGEERLLVLNRVARSVIEDVRGEHPEFVFTYCGHPVTVMNNSGWQGARKRVGLSQVRVHDLKHTFGHHLRAGELENLIEAANKV